MDKIFLTTLGIFRWAGYNVAKCNLVIVASGPLDKLMFMNCRVASGAFPLHLLGCELQSTYLQLFALLVFADHCFGRWFCKCSAQPFQLGHGTVAVLVCGLLQCRFPLAGLPWKPPSCALFFLWHQFQLSSFIGDEFK